MTTANAGQIDFWNGDVGERWLALENDLEVMNRAVTDHLVAQARRNRPERILEVGCGSGGLALQLAGCVGTGGQVLGVDISAPLVARARKRAEGNARLSFLMADAQTARLPGEFDLILSSFGMMFFDEPVTAFRNLRMAMRAGGRILFATFGGLDANPWFSIPRRIAVARLGAPPPSPPDAPGPTAFADRQRVSTLLAEAGWAAPQGEARLFDFHHPGGAAAAARLAVTLGPAAFVMRTQGATEADRQAVIAAIEAAFASYTQPDGLRLPVEINLFSAENSG